MSFEITGLEELTKQFEQMERGANELDKEIPLSELLTDSFMQKYTPYKTFDELLEAGGFSVSSQEDFEAIPDDIFDQHISKNTKFSSWDEMLGKAGDIYISKKLGL